MSTSVTQPCRRSIAQLCEPECALGCAHVPSAAGEPPGLPEKPPETMGRGASKESIATSVRQGCRRCSAIVRACGARRRRGGSRRRRREPEPPFQCPCHASHHAHRQARRVRTPDLLCEAGGRHYRDVGEGRVQAGRPAPCRAYRRDLGGTHAIGRLRRARMSPFMLSSRSDDASSSCRLGVASREVVKAGHWRRRHDADVRACRGRQRRISGTAHIRVSSYVSRFSRM